MGRPVLALFLGVAAAVAWPAPAPAMSPAEGAVTWEAEGLSELPAMLARAQREGKRLLVGLSGGDG